MLKVISIFKSNDKDTLSNFSDVGISPKRF